MLNYNYLPSCEKHLYADVEKTERKNKSISFYTGIEMFFKLKNKFLLTILYTLVIFIKFLVYNFKMLRVKMSYFYKEKTLLQFIILFKIIIKKSC